MVAVVGLGAAGLEAGGERGRMEVAVAGGCLAAATATAASEVDVGGAVRVAARSVTEGRRERGLLGCGESGIAGSAARVAGHFVAGAALVTLAVVGSATGDEVESATAAAAASATTRAEQLAESG